LGLSVGLVRAGDDAETKRAAYAADVTYVTNTELGYDYLRDNLATSQQELVQTGREPYFCLVDEADSILIDEARTPLIISKPAPAVAEKYAIAKQVADVLQQGRDCCA